MKPRVVKILLSLLMMMGGISEPVYPESQRVDGSSPKAAAAILPFVNHTDQSAGIELLAVQINKQLFEHSFTLVPSDELREVLRKHRIRNTAGISAEDAAAIRDELNVAFIILGSLDIFIPQSPYEMGFSIRIIDPNNMEIIWAQSAGSSGEDYIGLLGLGALKSVEELCGRVVEEAFDGFSLQNNLQSHQKDTSRSSKIAIVPFDNLSASDRAGDIISGILLSELIAKGQQVIEPGMVSEMFRQNRLQPRGEIDLEMLGKLNEAFDLDWVVTGEVLRFRPSQGSGNQSVPPEVELSCHLLSPDSGKILRVFHEEKNGGSAIRPFGLGKSNSMQKLSSGLIRQMLNTLLGEGIGGRVRMSATNK